MVGRLVVAASAVLVTSVAFASVSPVELKAPVAANRATARLAVSGSDGSHRVALWTATNDRREVCVGWALDSDAVPARFTCVRRGMEPPVLAVETAGGIGRVFAHGVVVGLASSMVGRLSRTSVVRPFGTRKTVRSVALGRRTALPGWRAFTTGALAHPDLTTLEAFDAAGRPLAGVCDASCWISGGSGRGGQRWQSTAAVPRGVTPAAQPSLSIALEDRVLGPLLTTHRSWVESGGPWSPCGHPLGYGLTFRLADPATFTATLPLVGPPRGNAAYSVALRRMRVEGANELLVKVDMNSRKVVGVEPQRWPYAPGTGPVVSAQDVSAPRDAPERVAKSCWESHD